MRWMRAPTSSGSLPRPWCSIGAGTWAIPLEAGRGLAAGIRGARFVTLEGSAHPPWIGGDDIAGIANAFFLGETQSAETTGPAHAASATGLDREHRCLVVEGAHVPLTPLEYGVMVALVDADGAVVTRDALLENVWGQPFEGSNKVDVLVRGLRRKLGIYAGSVETVTGHGYRFAGWRGPGTAGDSGGRRRCRGLLITENQGLPADLSYSS